MTSISNLRPTGGAIKGVWNVTPAYTPQVVSAPAFTEPTLPLPLPTSSPFAAFDDVNLTMTSSLADITSDTPPSWRQATAVFDLPINFITDTTKSYRFRLMFDDAQITEQTSGVVFGFTENTFANNAALEAILAASFFGGPIPAPYDTVELLGATLIGKGTGDVVLSAVTIDDTGMNTNNSTLGPISASNVLDAYVSYIADSSAVGGPGGSALAVIFILNGAYGGVILLPTATVLPGKTLNLFFGYASINMGGGYADGTISWDYTASPTTVDYTLVGAPSQGVVDTILGTPASLGSVTPESYTQVTTLPVGAAVDDFYRASVDVGYAGAPHMVKPLGVFAQDGEAIRIISTSPATIEVVNELRDLGGQVVTTSVQGLVSNTAITTTDGIANVATNIMTVPTADVGQYLYSAYVDKTIPPLTTDIHRIEQKIEKTLPSLMRIRATNVNVVSGSHEVVYTIGNFSSENDLTNYLDSYIANYNKYLNVNHPSFPTGTHLFGIYRKVTITGFVTPPVEFFDSLQTGVFSNYLVHHWDGVNSVAYIKNSSADYRTGYSGVEIGNTLTYGAETVTVTAVEDILLMSQPATATASATTIGFHEPLILPINSIALYSHDGTIPADQTSFTIPYPNTGATEIVGAIVYQNMYGNSGGFLYDTTNSGPYNQTQNNVKTQLIVGLFHQNAAGTDQRQNFVYVIPKILFGTEIKENTAVAFEPNQITNEFVLRWIDDTDVERSVAITDAVVASSTASPDSVRNASYTFGVTGSTLTFTGSAYSFETTDDVALFFQPTTTNVGVLGKNEKAAIAYVQGVDYTVTAQNEITLTAGLPSYDGVFYAQRMRNGLTNYASASGPGTIGAANPSTILTFMEANRTFVAFTLAHNKSTVNTTTASLERANPDNAIGMVFSTQSLTPTVGQLFTVDEDYDPTLGEEMLFQIKNACARVTTDGTFNGYTFKAGNFARWDGQKTVPFPLLPAATDTSILEPKRTISTSSTIALTSKNVIHRIATGTVDVSAFVTSATIASDFSFYIWITSQAWLCPEQAVALSGQIPFYGFEKMRTVGKVYEVRYDSVDGSFSVVNGDEVPTTAQSAFDGTYINSIVALNSVVDYQSGTGTVYIDAGYNFGTAAHKRPQYNDTIVICNLGVGSMTVAGVNGATVNAVNGFYTVTTQYKSAVLRYVGGDTWIMEGGEA